MSTHSDAWRLMYFAASRSSAKPQRTRSPAFDDIPPEAFEDAVPDAGGAGGGGKTCPHCTYVNPPGEMDCEVCGLPL